MNLKMEEQKSTKKIIYCIMAVIIIIGAIVCYTKGFNVDLQYSSKQKIVISNNTVFDKTKVEEIAKEILKNRKVKVLEIGRFSNAVEIISTQITDEEKSEIVSKVNEQLGFNISSDDIAIQSIPNTRIRDVLKPYIIPGAIITFIFILVYFTIAYHKIGLKYVLLKSIIMPIAVELLYYAIIAITRIPFGIVTNAIAIGIYVGSIKCIGTLFHQKKELILKKEQKENDK